MNGQETHGPSRVTMIDIARHAGVSKSTVSLVLQGSPLVKLETRDKVVAAVEALGYVYHRGAASLRGQRSNIVGMVLNDLGNPFFAELAVGIERVFHTARYVPFIANTSESPRRQNEVLRAMSEHDIAGLILCPARDTRSGDIEAIARPGVPIVLAMRRLAGTHYTSVTPDNLRGARRATEHLIAFGHRRIAFLGGVSDMVTHADRLGGYRAALAAAAIAFDSTLVVEGAPSREFGQGVIGRILDMIAPPSAALCFNDIVAFGVLAGLDQRRLLAGRDFAVVGFDDLAGARHTTPPLTTVHVDALALGERAAHQLLRMVHGDTRIEDFVSEVDLVVRESCGAAKGRRM